MMKLSGKKIVITGADGFIGSHVTEMMVKEAAAVKALVQYNSFNSWGWLDNSEIKNDLEIISGDIRDHSFCNALLADSDICLHLAALIAIPYSYNAPSSYIDVNVHGTYIFVILLLKMV